MPEENTLNTVSRRWRAIAPGAFLGMITGLSFALVECWFASIVPWMFLPGAGYAPVFRDATLAFLIIYILCGALLGGVLGLLTGERDDFRARVRTGSLIGIAAVFLVNAVIALTGGVLLLAEMAAVLAAILAIASLRKRHFLMNGFTTGLLLLLPIWASQEMLADRPKAIKIGVAIAAIAAVVLMARLLRRLSSRIAAVTLAAITIAASLTLGQASPGIPLPDPSRHSRLRRPNVVLITMDTVRADHLPLYGYGRDTTPNLRTLARSWTIFRRALATSNETLATHASIMTGMYASRHGAHPYESAGLRGGAPLAPDFRTLATALSEAGYGTYAVVANHAYLAEDFGLDHGFAFYDCRPPRTIVRNNQRYLPRALANRFLSGLLKEEERVTMFRRAGEINGQALQIVDRQGAGPPFFLFVNYMDAHAPYEPPHPFATRFEGNDSATTTGPVHSSLREEVNHYDGGIAYIDQQVAALISRLRARGLYDDTMIIVMADHGESFGEKGFWEHGLSVYEPQIHIPLFIKYPHERTGATVESVVSEVDLFPTILAAAGLQSADRLDGARLQSPIDKPAISEAFPLGWDVHWVAKSEAPAAELQSQKALSFGHYKLIQGQRQAALFDIQSDPAETIDVREANAAMFAKSRSELESWIRINAPRAGSAPLTDETRRRLRSLGYLR